MIINNLLLSPTFKNPTRFGWGGELSVVCRLAANCSSVSLPSCKKAHSAIDNKLLLCTNLTIGLHTRKQVHKTTIIVKTLGKIAKFMLPSHSSPPLYQCCVLAVNLFAQMFVRNPTLNRG